MRTSEVKSKFLVHASLEFVNLTQYQFVSVMDTIVRFHPHYLTSYSFPKNWDTIYDITLDISVDSSLGAVAVRNTLTQLAKTYSPTLLSSNIYVSDNTI